MASNKNKNKSKQKQKAIPEQVPKNKGKKKK